MGHNLHSISETILYVELYLPFEHSTHSILYFDHLPIPQISQAVSPLLLILPCSQCKQFSESSEAGVIEYLPDSHAKHSLDPSFFEK